MSVSPKRNAILLQFLHHFKPIQHHLVPDSGTGRSTLYTILQPWRQTLTLFLKTSRGTLANCLKFVVQFISCSWFWSADLISGLVEPIILVLNVQPTNQDNGRPTRVILPLRNSGQHENVKLYVFIPLSLHTWHHILEDWIWILGAMTISNFTQKTCNSC